VLVRFGLRGILSWRIALLQGEKAFAIWAAERPNIVHIVADDLGWKDVGFNGCKDIKTQNMKVVMRNMQGQPVLPWEDGFESGDLP